VPSSLSDALDALEADQDLVDAVGAELVAQHLAVKRAEWERFTRRHDGLGDARVSPVPLAPGHANRELFRPADEVRSKALARTGRFDARPGLGHLFEHDAQFESREVRAQT